MTVNGKLDRRALPEPDFGGGPVTADREPADDVERTCAPRSPRSSVLPGSARTTTSSPSAATASSPPGSCGPRARPDSTSAPRTCSPTGPRRGWPASRARHRRRSAPTPGCCATCSGSARDVDRARARAVGGARAPHRRLADVPLQRRALLPVRLRRRRGPPAVTRPAAASTSCRPVCSPWTAPWTASGSGTRWPGWSRPRRCCGWGSPPTTAVARSRSSGVTSPTCRCRSCPWRPWTVPARPPSRSGRAPSRSTRPPPCPVPPAPRCTPDGRRDRLVLTNHFQLFDGASAMRVVDAASPLHDGGESPAAARLRHVPALDRRPGREDLARVCGERPTPTSPPRPWSRARSSGPSPNPRPGLGPGSGSRCPTGSGSSPPGTGSPSTPS